MNTPVIIDATETPRAEITPNIQRCIDLLAAQKLHMRLIEPQWYNLALFIDAEKNKGALMDQLWEQL